MCGYKIARIAKQSGKGEASSAEGITQNIINHLSKKKSVKTKYSRNLLHS